MTSIAHSKKIGLALGGGGARGLAHIGVIQAFEKAGIPISYVAGTSMGALVGGWYAAKGEVYSLEDLFSRLKAHDVFFLREIIARRARGVFRNDAFEKLLEKEIGNAAIEKANMPFAAVATDAATGETVAIREGTIRDAVRASIALPFIFSPVRRGERLLMDGGFSDPVPADVVRRMGADVVVAVDVSKRWINISDRAAGWRDAYSVISDALSVIEYQISRRILEGADIVLRPPVMNFEWTEFNRIEAITRAGREEADLRRREVYTKAGISPPPKTLAEQFFDFLTGKE